MPQKEKYPCRAAHRKKAAWLRGRTRVPESRSWKWACHASAIAQSISLLACHSINRIFYYLGFITDRTHSKYGKARPWILWMSVPYAVTFVLLFLYRQMHRKLYKLCIFLIVPHFVPRFGKRNLTLAGILFVIVAQIVWLCAPCLLMLWSMVFPQVIP